MDHFHRIAFLSTSAFSILHPLQIGFLEETVYPFPYVTPWLSNFLIDFLWAKFVYPQEIWPFFMIRNQMLSSSKCSVKHFGWSRDIVSCKLRNYLTKFLYCYYRFRIKIAKRLPEHCLLLRIKKHKLLRIMFNRYNSKFIS